MSAQGRGGPGDPTPIAPPWGAGSLGGPPSTQRHPRALRQQTGPCGLNTAGMEGWESLTGTEEVEGWVFFLSERTTGPRSPPPCSSHLLSPPALFREPRLLASFPLQFLLVSTKLPLSEGWKASVIKGKEEKKKNKKKKASCTLILLPLPIPTMAPHHPSQAQLPIFQAKHSPSNAFEAGFSRPWIPPTVPAWLQSPSCSEAI